MYDWTVHDVWTAYSKFGYEYNRLYRRLQREADKGNIFLIRPQKAVEIDHMERDPEKLLDLYEQGYEQAMKTWSALQEYLAKP